MKFFVSIAVSVLLAANGSAQTLYGVGRTSEGARMVSIDQSTGETTFIVDFEGSASGTGLAFDQGTGTLFLAGSVLRNNQLDSRIFVIDPATGSTKEIADPIGIGGAGMVFDPVTGLLIAADGFTDELFSINPLTGEIATIGSIGFSRIFGLARDPLTGVLYGVDNDSGFRPVLVTIDPTTGAGTFVTVLSDNRIRVGGLAFDPVSRQLLGFDAGRDELISIDPQSGSVTRIGPTASFIGAMTYIPSPGPSGILALGALIAVRRRR